MDMHSLDAIAVEITNRCNLRCTMCCSHGTEHYAGQADGHPHFMELDFFKGLVRQYKAMPSNSKQILPQFQGESLVHPQFLEFCEVCEREEIGFGFTTNATLLKPDLTRQLLAFKHFNGLAFSIDGATSKTYEKIRIGAKYEPVVGNVREFLKQAALSRPDLAPSVSFTRQPDNEAEQDDFIRQWVAEAHLSVNIMAVDGVPVTRFWTPDRIPCRDLSHFMIILTNGQVVPCCRDNQYSFTMGNLFTERLEDIWNGPRYAAMREAQERGDYTAFPLCGNCDTWMCSVPDRKTYLLDGRIKVHQGPFWLNIPKQTRDSTGVAAKLLSGYDTVLQNPSGKALANFLKKIPGLKPAAQWIKGRLRA